MFADPLSERELVNQTGNSNEERAAFRGSRKHMLDWIQHPDFITEMNDFISPIGARIGEGDEGMPTAMDSTEARLDVFGRRVMPDKPWDQLRRWWLQHADGANTPNWDFASTCTIRERPGLLLVEAKAHKGELSKSGKPIRTRKRTPQGFTEIVPSARSSQNHEQIRKAISQACDALKTSLPEIAISRDKCYQLSNRIAFAWWLASHDIPVVLMYLGFVGDKTMRGWFENSEAWTDTLNTYAGKVMPKSAIGTRIVCGSSEFQLISRSRRVLQISPANPND
jgi:hypothetical protein